MIAGPVTTSAGATMASFLVTASDAGKLDAWIDFDGDGSWHETLERISTSSIDLVAGSNLVTYLVLAGAASGETFARFRFSSAGGLQLVIQHGLQDVFRAFGSAVSGLHFVRTDANDRVGVGDLSTVLSALTPIRYDGNSGKDQPLDRLDHNFAIASTDNTSFVVVDERAEFQILRLSERSHGRSDLVAWDEGLEQYLLDTENVRLL